MIEEVWSRIRVQAKGALSVAWSAAAEVTESLVTSISVVAGAAGDEAAVVVRDYVLANILINTLQRHLFH